MKTRPSFAKLVQGYLGFLTGTGKSLATISSYRSDLLVLENFLNARKKDFYALNRKDFAAYLHWMEKEGLKMNTRRRKILSAKALVRYAVSRKKLAPSDLKFVRAPDRLERLPWIPMPSEWKKILAHVKAETPIGLRNRLALLLLSESALPIAELCSLRWDQWKGKKLHGVGKKARDIELSEEAQELLTRWRKLNSGKHLFPGFNRHGITTEKMTARGVELYFRQLAKTAGFRNLKPKTLRHFAVTEWLRADMPESEIQRRLGVHKNYGFHVYRKFLESRA